jgi:aspartate/methionine/tyrosine aminotransferase
VEAFRRSFAERRDLVVEGLNRLPGVTCRRPGGAFYAFPNVAGTGIASKTLATRLLEEANVALVAGDSFGDNGRGYLRLSYAASAQELTEALGRMRAFLAAKAA